MPRARDFAVKVIRLGRAERRDGLAGLRPGGGVQAVRVDDAADAGERAIQHQMRRVSELGLRLPSTTFPSAKSSDDHVCRFHDG